jgi:segregation and condensation protein B
MNRLERLTRRLDSAKQAEAQKRERSAARRSSRLRATDLPAPKKDQKVSSATPRKLVEQVTPAPTPIALSVRDEQPSLPKEIEEPKQDSIPEQEEQIMATNKDNKLAEAKRIIQEGLEENDATTESPVESTSDEVSAADLEAQASEWTEAEAESLSAESEPDREIQEAIDELASKDEFEFSVDQEELEKHVAQSLEESEKAEVRSAEEGFGAAEGASEEDEGSDDLGEPIDVSAMYEAQDSEENEDDDEDFEMVLELEDDEDAAGDEVPSNAGEVEVSTQSVSNEGDDSVPAQGASNDGEGVTFLADPFAMSPAEDEEGEDVVDSDTPLEEIELQANEDALKDTGLGEDLFDEDGSAPSDGDDEDVEIEFIPAEDAENQLERLAEAMQQQTEDQQRKLGEMTEALGLEEAKPEFAQPLGPLEEPITMESLGLDVDIEADAERIAAAEAEERRIQEELDSIEYDEDLPIDMESAELQAAIEALLFVSDKPLPEKRLLLALYDDFKADDLNDDEPETADAAEGEEPEEIVVRPDKDEEFMARYEAAVLNLRKKYARPDSGIELVKVNRGWQLRTKQKLARIAKKLGKVQTHKLSKGALETLAIVAYQQPVLKDDVDSVRGVDSSHFIRILLDKKLLKMAGRSELPGRPILYGTTHDFLEIFGINTLDDLPPLKELEQMIPGSEAGGEDEPHLRKMRELVGKMNADKERLAYDPKEDDEFLKEIRERVKSIVTTTPTLEAEDEAAREAVEAEKAETQETLEALENLPEGHQPELATSEGQAEVSAGDSGLDATATEQDSTPDAILDEDIAPVEAPETDLPPEQSPQ